MVIKPEVVNSSSRCVKQIIHDIKPSDGVLSYFYQRRFLSSELLFNVFHETGSWNPAKVSICDVHTHHLSFFVFTPDNVLCLSAVVDV